MEQWEKLFQKTVEVLENRLSLSRDVVLIGDNSTGKSQIIKALISDKLEKKENIYFIDAVNRFFQISETGSFDRGIEFHNTVNRTRLQDDYFNLRDSWDYFGTKTERIEMIYLSLEQEVQRLLKNYVGQTFQIGLKECQEVIFEDGRKGKLSSGYQALIRLFLELLYYQKTTKEFAIKKCVVIDEIDEYLSPKNAGRMYNFLKKTFVDIDFVFTTHSADFIAGVRKADIIVLGKTDIEVLNADDFLSIEDVTVMFQKLFGEESEMENVQLDSLLRTLLNNKINKVWDEEEELRFRSINIDELSSVQKLIYRQIEEW
ncbi:MAG: hypothetical protein Q4B70_14125 [Lachnospiraceae bacterium]|nr:hypothetical protein [Lachnospiraceae bacterium]